jgi:hypothetical protein
MPRATRFAALALACAGVASLGAPAARAVDKCSAKLDARSGDLLVAASGVDGSLAWGARAGEEVQPFHDTSCVKAGRARSCRLAAPGSAAARTPPSDCAVYLDDGIRPCEARVKGCTPGVRATELAADEAAGRLGSMGSVPVAGGTSEAAAAELDSVTVQVPADGTLTVLLFADVFLNCDSGGPSARICGGAALALCTTSAAFDSCGESYTTVWHEDPDDTDSSNSQHTVTVGRTLPVSAGPLRVFVNGRSHEQDAIFLINAAQLVAIFQPGGALALTKP